MNSPSLSRIALASNAISWIAGLAIVGALIVSFVNNFMGMPIVEVSYSSGECVKVWTKDGTGSCDNLPTTYEKTWVK